MRILIVSHNCISRTSNMGKTLRSYFQGFSPEDIAQFYIHNEEPVDDTVCRNYYRFTDLDALHSVFSARVLGTVFGARDIHTERITARVNAGAAEAAYRYGEHRTAMGYLLRNLLWKCSRWNTKQLRQWLDAAAPDVVFFASGDYAFAYDVARAIADYVEKPLAVCCVDDYYLHNRNEHSLLGRMQHQLFLKTVHKTMARAGAVFTICDALKREYEQLFHKKCDVLHTAAVQQEAPAESADGGIAYLGKLELDRHKQLIAIGRALGSLHIPGVPGYLDVYSSDRDPELLAQMTPENGIRFRGVVSAEKVQQIMGSSMAVIHTESFEPRMQEIVRYSVSAKIPDSLMNGPCLIAYGPEGIASIDYLREHGAAYLITAPEQLEQGLREILTDGLLRERIVKNARELAQKNHSPHAGPERLKLRLEELCGGQ